MHTLTAEELTAQPQRLLDDARRGQADIVLIEGEPAMLTLPLGSQTDTAATLLELAVALYESDQVSIGRAAEIAGLAYGRMIDELGRRNIPVVRYSVEDLERELEYVRTLDDSR